MIGGPPATLGKVKGGGAAVVINYYFRIVLMKYNELIGQVYYKKRSGIYTSTHSYSDCHLESVTYLEYQSQIVSLSLLVSVCHCHHIFQLQFNFQSVSVN